MSIADKFPDSLPAFQRMFPDASMDLMVLSFEAGLGYPCAESAGFLQQWTLNRENLANSCWEKVS